jgi:four helix bundle protein
VDVYVGVAVAVIVRGDVSGDGDGDAPRFIATAEATHRYTDMLSFQKLDVYRCAVNLVALTSDLCGAIPRGHAALRDQLRRAALSVPLNIAEGAGRASDADSARHFAIARGSAMECAAVLDVLRSMGAVTDERYQHANELLVRVVSMLTKMGVRQVGTAR